MKNKSLDKFIGDKIREYREPSRAGTPRGEPIGFTTKKYKATLYMLYNLPHRELAAKIGVSHSLLRKWRTENEFLKHIMKHCEEFAIIFVGRLKESAKTNAPRIDEFLKDTPLEGLKAGIPKYKHELFLDLSNYSYQLLRAIAEELNETLREWDLYLISEIYLFLQNLNAIIIKGTLSGERIESLTMLYKSILRKLSDGIQELVVNILSSKKITELNRKQAAYVVGLMKQAYASCEYRR